MNKLLIEGLAFAVPLFIIALGGIYSERSGIINLALEGLQGFGAFTGALAVVLLEFLFPGIFTSVNIYLAMIFAMLGGMAFAMIHASLCIRFKANQVISGVVINILAVSLTEFLTRQINIGVFGGPSDKFNLGVAPRYTIPYLSKIPVIGGIFQDLYPFMFVIIAVAIIFYLLLEKTRFGMRLKACGDNPHAVESTGVEVEKIRYKAVLISGALSGLGGISFCYSISANFSQNAFQGFGYLSIAALIFGNWSIKPTLLASIFFGFSRALGYFLAEALKVDATFSDLIMILPYVLTLVLLMFFSKNNRAPRALGEIYDKGKR